jgi:hypothetical protein
VILLFFFHINCLFVIGYRTKHWVLMLISQGKLTELLYVTQSGRYGLASRLCIVRLYSGILDRRQWLVFLLWRDPCPFHEQAWILKTGSSAMSKNNTEMKNGWDNGDTDFWLPLQKYRDLSRNYSFIFLSRLQWSYCSWKGHESLQSKNTNHCLRSRIPEYNLTMHNRDTFAVAVKSRCHHCPIHFSFLYCS